MSGRKLLVYVAILLIVVGGYLVSEYYQTRQAVQAKAARQVFHFKAEELQAVVLKSDKGEIRLERQAAEAAPAAAPTGGEAAAPAAPPWRLVAPINAATDPLTMNSLLTALTELQVERRLDEVSPERRGDFGLDKPIFTVEIVAGERTHQLRCGRQVPGSQSIYAQVDEDPRVLVLRQSDKETLDRTLTALRAKEIFTLKPAEVTEIRLSRGQGKLVFRKTGPETWEPAATLQVKLRQDRINALVRQAAAVRALDFVAEKAEDLKKYGLAPAPTLRLTLLRDGQEETLIIGGQQGERYYAQAAGKAPIFLVDKALVEALPASYEALEDRRLWGGAETEVQKVIWGPPERQTVAVREKEGWTIQTGDQKTIQQSAMKMNLAFWRLKELEFIRLLPNAADLDQATPAFTLQLLGADNALLFRLAEYAADKDQIKVVSTVGNDVRAATVAAGAWQEVKDLLHRLAAPDKAAPAGPAGPPGRL